MGLDFISVAREDRGSAAGAEMPSGVAARVPRDLDCVVIEESRRRRRARRGACGSPGSGRDLLEAGHPSRRREHHRTDNRPRSAPCLSSSQPTQTRLVPSSNPERNPLRAEVADDPMVAIHAQFSAPQYWSLVYLGRATRHACNSVRSAWTRSAAGMDRASGAPCPAH